MVAMKTETWERLQQSEGIVGPAPKPDGWDELCLIRDCVWGSASLDYHWGAYGRRGEGMVLTPSAVSRIGMVMGWLATMPNTAAACRLAKDFIGHLDLLANYGGKVHFNPPPMCVAHRKEMERKLDHRAVWWQCPECHCRAEYAEGQELNLPRFIVDLRDDGTYGGFSLCWYVAIPEKDKEQHPNAQWLRDEKGYNVVRRTYDYSHSYQYAYSFNGGLLFHGVGEVFAVELNPRSGPHWSIHT